MLTRDGKFFSNIDVVDESDFQEKHRCFNINFALEHGQI